VTLSLRDAETILDAALQAADRLNFTPAVAVCDRLGRLVAFKRLDGAHAEAGWSAIGKAVASAGTGHASGEINGIVDHAVASVAIAEGVPILRVRGGLPIVSRGEILGGCGVDGTPTYETDEECARAAIARKYDPAQQK
jgi:uncharacterized protein GlcG (DUF336 family)